MNDEPDLELEAASAAVDGLATVDERALVDSSPSLQAEVERLAVVRASVADVRVPAGARESALAAALAAFDELGRADSTAARPAASTASPAPAVVSLESRRRRQYRAVLGAAAAVVVLGVGAVALTNRDDGDVETAQTDMTLADVEAASPAGRDSGASAATNESGEPGAGAAETGESAAGGDEATTADDDARKQAPAPAAESVEPLVINVPAQVIPSIESPEELLAFAAAPPFGPAADSAAADLPAPATDATETEATTAGQAPASQPPAGEATGCVTAATEYVGPVVYRGTSSHVVRVVATGEVRALDSGDCRLLGSATP